ncbi:hypothetical protein M3924_000953 [Vibrio fluvialis]|uniref:prepilin peptidase n=1 Tax=Vibrio fluvialis TaxID=676 RepID=UPI0005099D76|nr:prepilin peptidase [Vibrio fluvialis]EKO3485352.1 hypothetical protein [Vibrio fluvialis]
MSLYWFELGLLLIASVFDIRTMKVPNIVSYLLMLGPPIWLLLDSDFNFSLIELKSICLVLALTVPGFIKGEFGAADIRILLGLASVSPFNIMIYYIFITLAIFIFYSAVKFSTKNEAPFVPAIFITTGVFGLAGMV